MTPYAAARPDVLARHAVRVLGYASTDVIAALYALDQSVVSELLLDAQARGAVSHSSFGGSEGWSLTERGRQEDDHAVAGELDRRGTRTQVLAGHRRFLPLNDRLGPLMTRWQVSSGPGEPMRLNDHRDARYDDAVVRALSLLVEDLRPVTDALAAALPRFAVHQPRLDHAMRQVQGLRNEWVDSPDVPSVNLAWIQLHEDLVATLGIARADEHLDPATP